MCGTTSAPAAARPCPGHSPQPSVSMPCSTPALEEDLHARRRCPARGGRRRAGGRSLGARRRPSAPSMTAANAPTPGTTRPSASSTSSGRRSASTSAPAASRASTAEWTLPGAVVQDDDVRSGGAMLTARPSWTGCPSTRGSGSTAARRARAKALNWASTMWCGSRPAEHAHVQADAGVERDRLEDVPGQRTGEVAADQVVLLPGRLAAVHQVGTAGDVDDGLGERLVQRHQGVAEPADAGLVAQRLRGAPRRGRCRRPPRCGARRCGCRRWPRRSGRSASACEAR